MTRQEEISERLREAYMKGQVTVFTDAIAKELALLHDRVDRLANLAADAKQIAAEVERRFDSASFVTAQLAQAERVASAVATSDAPAPARDAGEVVEARLEWAEITASRSAEDPRREPTGEYEAETPFGLYFINTYFGTDSYGWSITFNGDPVSGMDYDDPDTAKRAAEDDYRRRLRAALAPDVRSVGTLSSDLTAAASALSDAQAVRDAALEEAAQAVEKAAVDSGRQECCGHGVGYEDQAECCGSPDFVITDTKAAAAIRTLSSSPPPEPVTEEELATFLFRTGTDGMKQTEQTRALLAAFTITRKPGA